MFESMKSTLLMSSNSCLDTTERCEEDFEPINDSRRLETVYAFFATVVGLLISENGSLVAV
jgi:hypothetical protein